MSEADKRTDSADDWLISRIDYSAHDPDFGFIEILYQTCSVSFTHLWKTNFRWMSRGRQKAILRQDVVNFRLWDETYPRGSLDTLLKESTDLRMSVVENLNGIGDILLSFLSDSETSTARSQSQNVVVQDRDLARNLGAQLERAVILMSSEDGSGSSTDSFSDDSSSESDLARNQFGRLNCYVRCLMDMTPVIENQLHRLQHNAEVEEQSQPAQETFHLSQNAQPFAMRIRDRFTHVPVYLVERLAEANWHRHVRIRAQQDSCAENENLPIPLKHGSLFHDSALGSSMHYATTVASHTSFISQSATGQEVQDHPRVPPLPRGEEGHFQCNYCRRRICVKNRIQWKMHVFADLQSYICTHPDCEHSLKTFPSRGLWADHELRSHLTTSQWRCSTCNATFLCETEFSNHQSTDHQVKLDGRQFATLISEAEESILKPGHQSHPCPFCLKSDWKSKREYATHVGHHLEEISLACLPMDEGESESGSGSDGDGSRTPISRNMELLSFNNAASYENDLGDKNKSTRSNKLDRSNLSLETLPPIIPGMEFKCKEPGCRGRFKRQEHLKRHMKSHSKEKPHVCWVPGCHRAFARSDNLNAHYTKTHSKRGGRNRYVATLDDLSPHYDPDFRGQLTAEGLPIYGTEQKETINDLDAWDD